MSEVGDEAPGLKQQIRIQARRRWSPRRGLLSIGSQSTYGDDPEQMSRSKQIWQETHSEVVVV